MNGTLEFFIIINLVGVFLCICAALFLLYLLISDKLFDRRKKKVAIERQVRQ